MSSQSFHKSDNVPILVKTLDSYGINIISSYTDFDLIGKRLNSSPLVYYYNSNTKAIIDYSQTESQDDLDYLSIFLQGITTGNTFSVTQGYYVKEQDGITSNVNGVYTFQSSVNDNLILADVVSLSAFNSGEYRYERDYFVDPPQLDLNAGFTGDTAYVIKSVTNQGDIEGLGLYEDDLVEISYTGNTANTIRYYVERVETSSEGEELIFVKNPLVSDNRIGQLTTLKVYVRGNPPIDLLSADKTKNGAAKTYTNDGVYLDCFENQNELQGYLRRYGYNQTNVLSTWEYGSNCDNFVSGSGNSLVTVGGSLIFNDILVVKTTTSNSTTVFSVNGELQPTIYLTTGRTYKFDQSHSTNLNSANPYQIVFTRVRGSTAAANLLTSAYSTNSLPGYQDSYTMLQVNSTLPAVFYYECLNAPNMGGSVVVTSNSTSRLVGSGTAVQANILGLPVSF